MTPTPQSRWKALAFASVSLLSAFANAEIRYSVHPIADNTQLKVTMTFTAHKGPIELQMPNWAPGDYSLAWFGRRVKDVKCIDAKGGEVTLQHPADNSWKGAVENEGKATIEYTVPVKFDAGALFYGGPATYMYIVDRKQEACRLSLDLPKEWKVAVGLEAVGKSLTEYRAPDYDVLADNPVTAGDFVDLHYTSHGKPITIALRGDLRTKTDQTKLLKMCQAISDTAGDFFGGLPFHKYVWHFLPFQAGDGGGGLEHLSSTQIALAVGLGPVAARICAHEFVHLWNVKRIRSKVLGPFDYTQLPKTGALYWLEGVTDYYASLLMLRSHYLGEDSLLEDLATNTQTVKSNPARLEVSAYESSLREPESSNGTGDGDGWRISYYNLGWLAGMCLDIDLRTRTNGEKSLDDVELALWSLCRNGRPGFQEGEIESQYVRMGGSKEFFERVVMKPGELPLEDTLGKMGLTLDRKDRSYVDRGFHTTTTVGVPNVYVDSVQPFAIAAGLADDDELLEVNGKHILGATWNDSTKNSREAMADLKSGEPLRLKIRRAGVEKEITYTIATSTVAEFKVLEDKSADAKQLDLRHRWFYGKPKS